MIYIGIILCKYLCLWNKLESVGLAEVAPHEEIINNILGEYNPDRGKQDEAAEEEVPG